MLKEYGMHATFNYVTSKISNDSMKKEILTSMENGNEIANHTSQWSSLSDLNVFSGWRGNCGRSRKSPCYT